MRGCDGTEGGHVQVDEQGAGKARRGGTAMGDAEELDESSGHEPA